jgi:hypothetical protein
VTVGVLGIHVKAAILEQKLQPLVIVDRCSPVQKIVLVVGLDSRKLLLWDRWKSMQINIGSAAKL